MLEKIKLLLGIDSSDKDEIIATLVALCKDQAIAFCNLDEYNDALNSIVIEMVIERYNKIGTEGLSKAGSSGISDSYIDGYSDAVLRSLRKHRKVKCV